MKRHLTRLAAMLAAVMLLAVLAAAPAYAAGIDISEKDPNPGARHEPALLNQEPGDGTPYTITLGDTLSYEARIPVNGNKAVTGLTLALDQPFELERVDGSFLDRDGLVLGRVPEPEEFRDNIRFDVSAIPEGTAAVTLRYDVRVVRVVSAGQSGMKNRLEIKYDDRTGNSIESAPVHTTSLLVKFVDTRLKQADPPKSSSGASSTPVPNTFPGQYVDAAQWVLYRDQDCTDKVHFVESFRRYDVCPDDMDGRTAVIRASKGPLSLVGLPAGQYYMKSIMPPNGDYGAPSSVIPVSLELTNVTLDYPEYGEGAHPDGLDYVTLNSISTGTELIVDYGQFKLGMSGILASEKFPVLVLATCVTGLAVCGAVAFFWARGKRRKAKVNADA